MTKPSLPGKKSAAAPFKKGDLVVNRLDYKVGLIFRVEEVSVTGKWKGHAVFHLTYPQSDLDAGAFMVWRDSSGFKTISAQDLSNLSFRLDDLARSLQRREPLTDAEKREIRIEFLKITGQEPAWFAGDEIEDYVRDYSNLFGEDNLAQLFLDWKDEEPGALESCPHKDTYEVKDGEESWTYCLSCGKDA